MKNLTVEITDKCPLACGHCSTYGAWDRDDILMPVEEFKQILKQNRDFSEIRLSGGEPFMHPGIIEFLRAAKLKNRKITILTCGVYRDCNEYQPIPEEKIQACKGIVDNINFSLHGSKQTHEEVVGIEGVFQHLDTTIAEVIKAGIPFSFGFVPLRTNEHDLEGAVAYASKKTRQQKYCSPKLYLLRYVKQGGNQHICDEPNVREELTLTQLENQNIVEQAKTLQERYALPIIPTCSMLESGCSAGIGKKVITVYGATCDCSALKWCDKETAEEPVACISRH